MSATTPNSTLKPLRGVRILSLALNLPGPAALMRLCALGASCTKLEPPAGDPMGHYNRATYASLHRGVKVFAADLRTSAGQKALARALARADVLLTSFRPSGLKKLGLSWKSLQRAYPMLSQVAIVGAHGARAEEPGHDLTYMAENDLVSALALPPTLYADMGGSLMATEAVLAAVLERQRKGKGVYVEIALAGAAAYLGLPRAWGMTKPGGPVGGAHAGYRMYACQDGRVAVAALEPHFAAALCLAAGVQAIGLATMLERSTHQRIAAFFAGQTCQQLNALGTAQDIPLVALPE